MLVFGERGKRSTWRKTSRSREENQQQTQPTYDAGAENPTRATLVGSECSRHYAIPAPLDVAFERARKCLEAKTKQLKKEGTRNRPNAAEALSDDEINILYEKTSWEFKQRSTDKHTLALQFTAFWSTRM